MLNLQKLTPYLQIPAEIYAGTPAVFRLRLNNSKRYLPSFLIRIQTVKGEGVTVPVVHAGSAFEDMVTITFSERGRAAVGRITVSSTFPVSFFTRYWTYSMDEPLIVFPRLLPGGEHTADAGKERHGSHQRLSRGPDGELERIADYSGVEPLRQVHWKLSARSDDLLIKEFGSRSVEPLIVDLQKVSGHTLEERISRAAWQVRNIIKERPVGLKLDNRIIPPASGKIHSIHLLTELALYGKA
jgi:uncharacterized protein (DUF58 family)